MTKKLIALMALSISLTAVARDYEIVRTTQCKTRAETAAYYQYKRDTGNGNVQAMAQMKSVKEGEVLHHMVDIIEFDTGVRSMITVSVNANTCKILDIN